MEEVKNTEKQTEQTKTNEDLRLFRKKKPIVNIVFMMSGEYKNSS